jgi:hypothetical protein
MPQVHADSPLMVRVLAHEVHAWEVELAATRRASCDLEDLWLLGVGKIHNLFLPCSSLRSVALNEVFVLDAESAIVVVERDGWEHRIGDALLRTDSTSCLVSATLTLSHSLTVPTLATPLRDRSCTTARGGMIRSSSMVSRSSGSCLACRERIWGDEVR